MFAFSISIGKWGVPGWGVVVGGRLEAEEEPDLPKEGCCEDRDRSSLGEEALSAMSSAGQWGPEHSRCSVQCPLEQMGRNPQAKGGQREAAT